MKETLKQFFYRKIKEEWGTGLEVANNAGYAKTGGLTRVLKNEKQEFEYFYGIVYLAKHYIENLEEEKQKMTDFALSLDENKQTARYMLEYADINKLDKLKEELIAKLKSSSNKTSRAWAKVYEADLLYTSGKANLADTLDELGSIKTDVPELEVASKIFKAYCYLDKKAYSMIDECIKNVEKILENVKDKYIKDLMYGRYLLLMVIVNERKGNMIHARAFAKRIINDINNEYILPLANLHLGNSYIIEDFQKAEKFIKKGMLQSYGVSEKAYDYLTSSMNFLYNVWNKQPLHLNLESEEATHVHEVAYSLINKDQKEDAVKLLDKLNKSNLNNNEKAFHFYLRGLISNSMNDYCSSVKFFRDSGDMYFRTLPLIELEKMGVPDDVINILAV